MKILILIFALIAAAFAAPQFFGPQPIGNALGSSFNLHYFPGFGTGIASYSGVGSQPFGQG